MELAQDLIPIAERAMRAAAMESVGLYTFDETGGFERGVILGMPDAFVKAYEISGIPIDPVLARVRKLGTPTSTVTCLGDRWSSSELYRRVSGRFGLKGFATLPLYRGTRLAGVLYLGSKTDHSLARLATDGLCEMSVHATSVSTELLTLPQRHPRLSPRQDQVAHLAAQGFANREIAEELDTGEAAVRKHLKALNRIFGTSNRTAMAAVWRQGLQ